MERLRSILVKVEDMWDKPINLFEKVKNPTETDETEDEKNELVIWTMQITVFLYLCQFYILVKIKTWELGPILELVPILELEPPSNLAKKN